MDSANPYALRAGTVVGDYRLIRVLGAGGFGITYEASHRQSGARVALKEYLPFAYGSRAPGSSDVQSAPGEPGDIFRWGRERFMKEAQTLARLDHPSIVQVSGFFEANNTAYMALGYEQGGTLGEWLEGLGRTPTQAELSSLAWSLTEALAHVHSLFLLHRDIKPDNIMLRPDLTPVLIDFGTAKAALVGHTRVLDGAKAAAASSMVVVSDGYSPPEQYVSKENLQGPWTDVYALAATLYRAIAGTSPPPASERMFEDSYQPLTEKRLGDHWRPDFLAAIDNALAVKREQRPQSAPEFRRALGVAPPTQKVADIPTPPQTLASSAPPGPPTRMPTVANPAPPSPPPVEKEVPSEAAPHVEPPRRSRTAIVAVLAACALAGAALFLLAPRSPQPGTVQKKDTPAIQPVRGAVPLTAAQEQSLRPKDAFTECNTCPEMVVVPAGSFMMGSPQSEPERIRFEGPQHQVTFARPFAVGRFAATFAEWDACVADGGCNGYRPSDRGWGRGRRPAINVSWNDAKAYVAWLSRKTGKAYRLLSEAEREYVTRAGTATPFWWGSTISTDQANYDGKLTYGGEPKGEDRQRTIPVDSFQPNPWGLYQVHGNVWEWTEDCWNDNYKGAPTDGSAWTAGECGRRVNRGGSFNFSAQSLRSAYRKWDSTADRDSFVGFRVARTLDR